MTAFFDADSYGHVQSPSSHMLGLYQQFHTKKLTKWKKFLKLRGEKRGGVDDGDHRNEQPQDIDGEGGGSVAKPMSEINLTSTLSL